MSVLSLERVCKRRGERSGPPLLHEVSLELQAGELVVVWGLRRSGRSTLLRLAAGIEPPDSGVVRFCGRDLAQHGERLFGNGIGYCQRALRFTEGQRVLDHAMVPPLSRWTAPAKARALALAALERAGATHCAQMRAHELSSSEAVRVALARTLTLGPQLVVIDEPVKGVELGERDGILRLLRSLADEGIAVLASTGESTGLSEADRALTLGRGELRGAGAAEMAPVLPLRRRAPQAIA